MDRATSDKRTRPINHQSAPLAYDVIVIGGGASGLSAALAAARAGARTAVVERDVECGLPILATGNGRCNLSNADLSVEHYRHPSYARAVFGSAPESNVEKLFSSVGLLTVDQNGWIFPRSKRAESVRSMLLQACDEAGVKTMCCASVEAIQRKNRAWHLRVSAPQQAVRRRNGENDRKLRRRAQEVPRRELELSSPAIVVATGGKASTWAQTLDLPIEPESPVLCPIACASPMLNGLEGTRIDCEATLVRQGSVTWHETGEAQFRSFGLSGIMAFNLSRRVAAGDTIRLNFTPEIDEQTLAELLVKRFGPNGGHGSSWLDGVLPPALGRALIEYARSRPSHGKSLVQDVAHLCTHCDLQATGLADTDRAQVTRGGLSLTSFDPVTLEARNRPGIFAAGEVLDQDADCGGYNLAWAWLTGMRAGASAARAAAAMQPSAENTSHR